MKIYAVDNEKKELYQFNNKNALIAYFLSKLDFPRYLNYRWKQNYTKNKRYIERTELYSVRYYKRQTIKNIAKRCEIALINVEKYREIKKEFKDFKKVYCGEEYVFIE